jgi:hypothetical protein
VAGEQVSAACCENGESAGHGIDRAEHKAPDAVIEDEADE